MQHESNKRDKAIKKLEFFIKNPGYFSILVLGDNGVGKEYVIKRIFQELEENIEKYYPYELGETKEEMAKIFKSGNGILIKDIENLTEMQQNLLFKALSTADGEIGFDDKRVLKRIIFSSSYNVEQLRESKEHISDKFWDRISQLAVKIPSFKDFSSNIIKDFEAVWQKMDFQEYPKLPKDGGFQSWLKENCSIFSGNFRDLDKIAILWHQYRIIEYEGKDQKFKSDVEARIFRKVRKDFEDLVHFPTQKVDTTNVFEFTKGKTWEQIERGFKTKFKAWAKENYGTIKNATEELNMPLRKMDKW